MKTYNIKTQFESKFYKDLTIDEKINAKSWGFWRNPNAQGFMLTMVDNANVDHRDDYANYMRHYLAMDWQYQQPRFN